MMSMCELRQLLCYHVVRVQLHIQRYCVSVMVEMMIRCWRRAIISHLKMMSL